MKKAFIMLLCLCLCGCSAKSSSSKPHLETKPYITQQQTNSIQNITIYVYNETTNRLESKIIPVTIYPDQTRAEAALGYLLSTPEFEFSLNSYGVPDYSLTVAGGIATVKITNKIIHDKSKHFKCFALHFSIVNTLCSIEGINYVSVYAGDGELAGDIYVGPSKFLETSISDHYVRYYGAGNQNSHNEPSQKSMMLYYGEKSQEHIVPEQHQIYTNIDSHSRTVNSLLAQMAKSPTNSSDLIAPVSSALGVNKLDVKNNTMSIDFNMKPSSPLITNEAITYSAIYNSIICVYPKINSIEFTINGSPITINGTPVNEKGIIDKNTFKGTIGSAVCLYMADSSMTTLYPLNRYLSASSGTSVMQIIDALMSGPAAYDNNALISPIFGDLKIDNLISAKVVNDIAILNFDTDFYDAVKTLSESEETIMIYAIVNTLTAREQINKVQFLINNQSFDTINGHIYYSSPLLGNPGLIMR